MYQTWDRNVLNDRISWKEKDITLKTNLGCMLVGLYTQEFDQMWGLLLTDMQIFLISSNSSSKLEISPYITKNGESIRLWLEC